MSNSKRKKVAAYHQNLPSAGKKKGSKADSTRTELHVGPSVSDKYVERVAESLFNCLQDQGWEFPYFQTGLDHKSKASSKTSQEPTGMNEAKGDDTHV